MGLNDDEIALRILLRQHRLARTASAAARRWLARPFRPGSARRIVVGYVENMLAMPQFYAFFRYRKRFLAEGFQFRAVPFEALNSSPRCKETDAIFIQAPYDIDFIKLGSAVERLATFAPSARLSFFDWAAPSDLRFAHAVDPWVTSYVKKGLLRDGNQHLQVTGHTLLSDYYSARFSVPNPPPEWPVDVNIFTKLAVSPAFSTAPGLIESFESAKPHWLDERPLDLHARIATKGTPWYSAMRQEALDAARGLGGDIVVVSEGRIARKQFLLEMSRSKLCFSPFGYGELCWRDFEAVMTGSVLVKPDMGHMQCEPDIFVPYETYLPVRWDLSDLGDVVRAALADSGLRKRVARRAYRVVHEHLRGPAMTGLTHRLLATPGAL